MEAEHHHDHNGGFMYGFLLGAIIGAAVVFFLFTEKGRKLLKTITEEGIEDFSDLRSLVQNEMDDEEEGYETAEDEMYAEEPVEHLPHIVHHADHTHVEPLHRHEEHVHYHEPVGQAQGEEHHHSPSKVKRFFRSKKN